MKTILYFFLFFFCIQYGFGQYEIVGDPLLCPNETDTLYLTGVEGDSVQWYKRYFNDSLVEEISGANDTFLEIDEELVVYRVHARIWTGGPVIMTEEVLIDQLVFLPVTVTSTGEYATGMSGEFILCEGDSLFFTLNLPYTENITWYRNFSQVPGATDDTLLLTYEDPEGTYTVSASPGQCPDYQQFLGVGLHVIHRERAGYPQITLLNDTTATLENPTLLDQWVWLENGVFISESMNMQTFSFADTSEVELEALDNNGCLIRENIRNFLAAGQVPFTEIKVSPNPALYAPDLPEGTEKVTIFCNDGKRYHGSAEGYEALWQQTPPGYTLLLLMIQDEFYFAEVVKIN